MRPGDIDYHIITVKNSGVAVLGLLTANFTVFYGLDATTPAAVFTVTEISGGRYRVALTLPGVAGWMSIFITSNAGYTVENGRLFGQLEAQDFGSLFAVVVRPLSQLAGTSALASEVAINLNANRRKALSVSVVNQAGAAVDLSGYNNFRFSVWDQKHLATIYLLNTGITGTVGGVVSWTVPETASFFTQIDASIANGDSQLVLYYDMIADAAATLANTECIFRGQLILTRYEGAA